jgi:hypothetical protein
MQKIKLALVSRTVWVVVALFIFHGFTGVHDMLPANITAFIDPVLSLLAIYFRVSPQAEGKV